MNTGDLNPKQAYTFICTDKNKSPAGQNAIYLYNEYGEKNEKGAGLNIPRPE